MSSFLVINYSNAFIQFENDVSMYRRVVGTQLYVVCQPLGGGALGHSKMLGGHRCAPVKNSVG